MTAPLRPLQADQPRLPLDAGLPWVHVAPGAPYFVTEAGEAWTPIGQNDAVTWPDLAGLFRRRDVGAVERHLAWMAGHGVTCLRVMMEYAQGQNRVLERPVGTFQPNMVRFWDDLFALCERLGLRLLLTPFDTFWMARRWDRHPYSAARGGPCGHPSDWLTSRGMIEAVKARMTYATTRWGRSGALFAWDLWNEIDPDHAHGDVGAVAPFIAELSGHLRDVERRVHGRSHPQTVSLFEPTRHRYPGLAEPIFRHPSLDFASSHLYEPGPLDHPRDTVEPAIRVGALVREALAEMPPERPYLDSENGPIHLFARRGRMLPDAVDDELFRHMQWAHLASGGTGGGMRWPYRHPHVLTHGMRRAQQALVGFLPLIDWARFRRRNLNEEARVSDAAFAVFACGDERQAVAWLLRRDRLWQRRRMVDTRSPALAPTLSLPGMADGRYRVTAWDTREGRGRGEFGATCEGGTLAVEVPPTVADVALAIRPEA